MSGHILDSDKNTTLPGRSRRRGPHGDPSPDSPPSDVAGWIRWVARRLEAAQLCHANGLQEPYLEAEYLVLHAFSIPFETKPVKRPPPPADAEARVRRLLERRVNQRQPAPYVTGEAFFAGHRFFVDERVLIPRSRIENILDDPRGFSPWFPKGPPRRILDLCTGSGCLAIALALRLPQAKVDGVDLSKGALQVARLNRDRFGLRDRVRLIASDLFAALGGERYDLIVTNPPYVPRADFDALPPEYHREPAMALVAGEDGLDLIGPILRQASDHLNPRGVLICETGDDVQEILMRRWPDLPVTWLPFHFGGSGVFALTREELEAWCRQHFP
ncbi:MAG: 50S ribosomal protein L3 N(5)-glutamine methyltransferase [Magnetococcales bacterium]|nr:50S ribosomal protein L3 N(5)-glutamine methyltransferase [Magnetococcales bacterium]